MKCRVRCRILLGLVALLQIGRVFGNSTENDHSLMLQTKVENLIEKILKVIEDYYDQIRTELKCIPDEVPDTIIGTLKNAIDCVDENERNYQSGRIAANVHKKSFLKCFSDAKAEVEETISSIDPTLNYCPENMTEKTYQINVTTTITKTFHINIKNGLEIMKKEVNLGNEEKMCVFNQMHSGKSNQTASHENEIDEEDNSSADENEVSLSQGHQSPPQPQEHESKKPHDKGHPSKETPHKGPQSKEHHGVGSKPEDGHGKEHELTESSTQGHVSKEHQGKESVLTQSSTQEHASKEQERNDIVLGTSYSVDENGGYDSSNANDVWYKPDIETDDYSDNGESNGDQDNYFPPSKLPGHGGASNDDNIDEGDDYEENENEFSNGGEYDEESNSSGLSVSRADSAQDNYEESEAKGHHHIANPDSKEFRYTSPSSEHQLEDYENDDNSYLLTNNYDGDDVYDDADYDEDMNFPKEGEQNTVSSIADPAAHDIEIKNKKKDENPFSGHDLTTDDGGHNILGTGHEKLFIPGITTPPPGTLGSPTNKPHEQDYDAGPDTAPENFIYRTEFYDTSGNFEKSLEQRLGQSKSTPAVAQRIQMKPKSHINRDSHQTPPPKHGPQKEQKRRPPLSVSSLSQTISKSDF